jgi:hypothetical protein
MRGRLVADHVPMSPETATILVVANPDAQPELRDILARAGFPDVEVGDGSDDTFVCYEQTRPEVVVICADIDRGDARALASAIRGGDDGALVRMVLIGDRDGPVRNALDAADYDVDRFVGRPLSPKALAFAVRTCAEAARADRAAAPPVAPEPHDTGVVIQQAVDAAIDHFVDDAMGALSDTVAVRIDARGGVAHLEQVEQVDDAWDAPAPTPAWREPTLILSGGGQAPAPDPVAVTPTEPQPASPSPVAPEATEEQAAPVEHFFGTGAGPADDLDEDPGTGPVEPDVLEPDVPEAPGGGFGRQLRHKMSMMAERLFAASRDFDAGVAHDHHTEIDLTALGVDTVPGIDHDAVAYDDMRAAQTYADPGSSPGDDSQPAATTTHTSADNTTTRRRSLAELPARGALQAGDTDAALLIARAFAADFTGRIVCRRAPAEKTLYFEEGRPVFATSNLPHDRMGDLLYREGKITRAQHARSRELVMESGRRMGEILVEKGFLKRRELLPAVRRHIEDIVYSLFGWHDGEFQVIAGAAAEAERIRLSRHPAALILEGVRRKYDLDRLATVAGTAEAVIAVRDRDRLKAVVDVADLSPAERAAIDAFDGARTLEAVADRAGVGVLAATQLAYGLLVMGAAERTDHVPDELAGGDAPSLVGATDLAIDRQRVLAKHALVGEADYFTLLGVRRDASGFEIKRAYEAARRDYAGDSFPVEVRRDLGEAITEINELLDEAYRVLCDDHLRTSYRSHLRD